MRVQVCRKLSIPFKAGKCNVSCQPEKVGNTYTGSVINTKFSTTFFLHLPLFYFGLLGYVVV